MNRKWTLEKVKELFTQRNCTLLSTEYINTKQKLDYIAECGHKHQISIDNFVKGKGVRCKECRYRFIGEQYKHDYDEVYSFFKENCCKLLSKDYKSNDIKLEYIAQCGHKNRLEFAKFKNGSGRVCNKCSKSIRYEYDYVSEYFLNNDCHLLEEEYINAKTPMKYIAQCGHVHYINFDTFKNCPNTSMKCPKCQKRKYSYTPVEEKDMYQMRIWRKSVYEKDDFACQKCGKKGGKLNAHHKNGYNLDKENRLNVDNGITLCEPCHIEFHKTYGYGLNTEEQLNHWFYGNTEVKHTSKGVAHRNA